MLKAGVRIVKKENQANPSVHVQHEAFLLLEVYLDHSHQGI